MLSKNFFDLRIFIFPIDILTSDVTLNDTNYRIVRHKYFKVRTYRCWQMVSFCLPRVSTCSAPLGSVPTVFQIFSEHCCKFSCTLTTNALLRVVGVFMQNRTMFSHTLTSRCEKPSTTIMIAAGVTLGLRQHLPRLLLFIGLGHQRDNQYHQEEVNAESANSALIRSF